MTNYRRRFNWINKRKSKSHDKFRKMPTGGVPSPTLIWAGFQNQKNETMSLSRRNSNPVWWLSLLLCPIGIAAILGYLFWKVLYPRMKQRVADSNGKDDACLVSNVTMSKKKKSVTYYADLTWIAVDNEGRHFRCKASTKVPDDYYTIFGGNSEGTFFTDVYYNRGNIKEWMLKEEFESNWKSSGCGWPILLIGLVFAGAGIWQGIAGALFVGNMNYAIYGISIGCGIGVLFGLWSTTFSLNTTMTFEPTHDNPGNKDVRSHLGVVAGYGTYKGTDRDVDVSASEPEYSGVPIVPPPPVNSTTTGAYQ
jgi:hypothetical protein